MKYLNLLPVAYPWQNNASRYASASSFVTSDKSFFFVAMLNFVEELVSPLFAVIKWCASVVDGWWCVVIDSVAQKY